LCPFEFLPLLVVFVLTSPLVFSETPSINALVMSLFNLLRVKRLLTTSFGLAVIFGGWNNAHSAPNVLVSNINPKTGEANTITYSTNGFLLPSNSLVRVGTFTNAGTNAAQLAAFVSTWTNAPTTSEFLSYLDGSFQTWNTISVTNTNSPGWPGNTAEISISSANSALASTPMYMWIYNTATHAEASGANAEMLILRAWDPAGFPDPSSGEFGPPSNFNLFPSDPDGLSYPDPTGETEDIFTSYGVSVLFGQYFSDSLQFRMSGVNPRSEITSLLVQTNATGSPATYQITANNGADRFFATTNTANADLTLTNLPAGFSIATNTGVITAGTNAAANTYSIRLVASNSVTASVATNTLTWTLQASSLSFTTTTNLISAFAGVQISPFTFVSTGTSPTYTADGNLRGLILSTNGLLSGIPSSVGTNDVTITSSAGGQNGTTTFSLAVAAPTISVPAGELTGGQIVHTAGTARTVTLSKSAGFTDLTGQVSPTTSGVTFNGTDLVIAADAAPFLKGLNNINLTLTASKAVGSGVSASTTVPLRIVAPTPTRLVGPTEFEVDVGEAFSATILSDAGTYGRMIFSNLPSGLAGNQNGVVAGTNRSTNLPYEFAVKVVADSTQIYEGGGTYTNTNMIFRLRNTNPPYFVGTNRYMLAVGRAVSGITLAASNFPFKYTASNLPAGLQLNGDSISGVPTVATNSQVLITAYNSIRPGSTNPADERPGYGALILNVAGAKPTAATALSGSNDLRVGNAASFSMLSAQELGLRIAGYGFPPGLSIDSSTGLVTGTPIAAGTYAVTVFIQNGKGWIKKTVSLTVR
jgi:hypothetical protein